MSVSTPEPAFISTYLYSQYYTGVTGPWDYGSYSGVTQNLWGMPGVTVSEKNPNWKEKVLSRVDASTPYSTRRLVEFDVRPSFLVGSDPTLNIPLSASETLVAGVTSMAPTPSDEDLRDLALTRFKRKLKRERSKFESLVPLAEAKDLRLTAKGLVKSATSLVESLVLLRRKSGRQIAKQASEAWLTWSFGVKPVLKDIHDLNEAITDYLVQSDKPLARFASGAEKTWYESAETTVNFNRLAGLTCLTTRRCTLSYKYVGGYSFPAISSARGGGASPHFGLSVPEIVPALWNVMAYSWIVDYFTTLGDVIEDTFVSPPGDATYAVLNKLYVAEITTNFALRYQTPTPIIHSWEPGVASGKLVDFSRTIIPHDSLPRSLIRFKTTEAIADNGVTKLLNLASLLLK